MPLYVVATPIGPLEDLSPRAIQTLRESEIVIGEEYRVVSTLLKKIGVLSKQIELLNEHSQKRDLDELVEFCKTKTVSLVSDCGTPGFCDPGADLVFECRKAGVQIRSLPGPSSLMTFLSLCGLRLDQFVFSGFLPAANDKRTVELKKLRSEKRGIILMDTPYRLQKFLSDLLPHFESRSITIGINLSQEDELVLTGSIQHLIQQLKDKKGEFMLLIHPSEGVSNLSRKKGK